MSDNACYQDLLFWWKLSLDFRFAEIERELKCLLTFRCIGLPLRKMCFPPLCLKAFLGENGIGV